MAADIRTFVLPLRASGTRIPELIDSDGYPTTPRQNDAIGHPESDDVADDIPSPNGIDLADLRDGEEETNSLLRTHNDSPRRPPNPLASSRRRQTGQICL
jgi:hypothetical protein